MKLVLQYSHKFLTIIKKLEYSYTIIESNSKFVC